MKSNCDTYKGQLEAAFYDELKPDEKLAFRNHLQSCKSCKTEWEVYQSEMKILDDPFEDIFSDSSVKVTDRLKAENPFREKIPQNRSGFWMRVAAILLIGMMAGMVWFFMQDDEIPPSSHEFFSEQLDSELKQDLSVFFDRAGILFMSLGHLEIGDLQSTEYTFSGEITLAGELLTSVVELSERVDPVHHPHLADLLEECSILIRSLAREASPDDYESIWVVHATAEDRAVIPRITLEKYRLGALADATF